MIRLRQPGADEVLIKRVRDWYDPGPGVFIQSLATASFSPSMLFTGSTTGVWYDPSDITTLFQDAAGTTPVTAVEQPVGLMLDKSGRGNHAFNPSGNSANFPALSAKYNLLTKTEDFSDAVWVKQSATVSSGATDPLGGTSAWTMTATSVNGQIYQQLTSSSTGPVISLWIRRRTGSGTVSLYNGTTTVPVSLTSSWQAFSVIHQSGIVYMNPVIATSGDAIDIWHPDIRQANDALNQPAYQRVNTSSDYDTVGFKLGEVFDGINDYLTASAGGGSTTSFFWCSAIRVGKVGAVQTLFSDAGTNTGYRIRINASNKLELSAGNGTAYTTVSTTATLSIGQRSVLTAWHDGTNLKVQINNGTVHQVAFSTATAGTAQFTIGKDNNAASNFFAGWLYEKVYTKDNVPSSAQIADTKAYVANIAGITL